MCFDVLGTRFASGRNSKGKYTLITRADCDRGHHIKTSVSGGGVFMVVVVVVFWVLLFMVVTVRFLFPLLLLSLPEFLLCVGEMTTVHEFLAVRQRRFLNYDESSCLLSPAYKQVLVVVGGGGGGSVCVCVYVCVCVLLLLLLLLLLLFRRRTVPSYV